MDPEELEREYSPSSRLPDGDYRPFVAEYVRASAAAWQEVTLSDSAIITTLPYGESTSQTIDLAVPADTVTPVPLLVFIHGGYWQELSSNDSRFPAMDCIARGWAFAAVDYTLAPLATLPEIIEEVRVAIRTLHAKANELGVDVSQIFVSGSSAGAHLAAATNSDELDPPIRGLILVSGVYELEPLITTSINDAVGIDATIAADHSPLRADLANFPPTLIAWGGNETSEFKAQSTSFATALESAGVQVSSLQVDGRNHFDVILDLATAGTELGDAVARLLAGLIADDDTAPPGLT